MTDEVEGPEADSTAINGSPRNEWEASRRSMDEALPEAFDWCYGRAGKGAG